MKVFSLSNRFYYREFPDLKPAHVLHKVFENSGLHQLLKKQFHLSDHIPLSATHEAKALLKANASLNNNLIRKTDKRMKRIKMKIKEKETKLEKFICEKEKLIHKTKQHETTEKDYLYEVTVIDPEIKKLKNQIKLLNTD